MIVFGKMPQENKKIRPFGYVGGALSRIGCCTQILSFLGLLTDLGFGIQNEGLSEPDFWSFPDLQPSLI